MAERHSWAVGAVAGVGQVDELDARLTIGGLVAQAGLATSRGGVFPAQDWPGYVSATSPTPNGEVHVAPFRGALQSVRAGGGGVYVICNDEIVDVDVLGDAPADPANDRIDLIVWQQSDTYHGDADSNLRIRHVIGTPAVSPVDPDPEAGGLSPDYFLAARITVQAGATVLESSDIENLDIPFTVAAGGMLPIFSEDERDAIEAPYFGMPIYRIDRDWIEVYDGTAWRVHGVATVSSAANRTSTITHPRAGTLAYRTDTKSLDVYDGTTWRGTREVNYDTPTASGSGANGSFTGTQNTVYTIASVVIPDPGFPYRIAGRAGLRLTAVSAAAGYVSHAGAIMVDSSVPQDISAAVLDDTVTASFLELQGAGTLPVFGFLNLPYRRAKAVYTGSHTVRFLFKPGLQGTAAWGPLNTQSDYYFQLDVIPA